MYLKSFGFPSVTTQDPMVLICPVCFFAGGVFTLSHFLFSHLDALGLDFITPEVSFPKLLAIFQMRLYQ